MGNNLVHASEAIHDCQEKRRSKWPASACGLEEKEKVGVFETLVPSYRPTETPREPARSTRPRTDTVR